MGIIGPKAEFLDNPQRIIARDQDPPVVQLWDVLPINEANGSPIQNVTFDINLEEIGQPLGHCNDLLNRTVQPNDPRKVVFGNYVGEHEVTTVAEDEDSSCVDVQALEIELNTLQVLYAIARDTLIGTGAGGQMPGIENQLTPDRILDLNCDPLTKNDLILAHNAITIGNNRHGYILGNALALKAFMEAHFVEGLQPEYCHRWVCNSEGKWVQVQVPKFMGFEFVRVDLWPVTPCIIEDGGAEKFNKANKGKRRKLTNLVAKGKRQIIKAGKLAQDIVIPTIFSTDLVFLTTGPMATSYWVQAKQGRNLFQVRGTMIPQKSHIENAVYATITINVATMGSAFMLRGFTVPPANMGPFPNISDIVTANFTHSV